MTVVSDPSWNYNDIFNKRISDNVINNKNEETMSGLETISKAIPYSDIGTMDIAKLMNKVPYSFTEETCYINLSKKGNVYVRDRNLNVFSISPIVNIFSFSKEEVDPPEQLLIVKDYKFGDSRAALETLHLMELSRAITLDDIHTNDREFICNDLRQVVKNLSDKVTATYRPEPPVTLRFVRYVPLRDIRDVGIFHLINLDITISLDRRMCLDPFPEKVMDVKESSENKGYHLSIEIIDNNDLISSKYIKGIKDIIRVPIITNPLLPNSLRIEETINGEVVSNVISDLSIESLNSHGVYSTKEEAITSKDPHVIKLLSSLEKTTSDYKEAVSECNDLTISYKAIIDTLEKENAILKRQLRDLIEEEVNISSDQPDWVGIFGGSLDTVGKFANTASKTIDLISKLGKFRR